MTQMKLISFEVPFSNKKKLIFSSEIGGLKVEEKEYNATRDGVLIYDKTKDIRSNEVICQLSTNTSTLIPSFRILGIPYNPYFDKWEVVKSQNDITFYWKPSRLAAFYNRFSTDGVPLERREEIIRNAVEFLIKTAEKGEKFLPEEKLSKLDEECKLLGFFEGVPIFDANFGLPQLQSRLGIHIGTESILVSTPLDRYFNDIEEVARIIEEKSGEKGVYKKNRVRFEKSSNLVKVLFSLG